MKFQDDECYFFCTIYSMLTKKLFNKKKQINRLSLLSIYVEYYCINLYDNMFQSEHHYQEKFHLVYNIDLRMFDRVVDQQNPPIHIKRRRKETPVYYSFKKKKVYILPNIIVYVYCKQLHYHHHWISVHNHYLYMNDIKFYLYWLN